MTGTPSGVVVSMKDRVWLKDADTVDVIIEKIRRIRNRIMVRS